MMDVSNLEAKQHGHAEVKINTLQVDLVSLEVDWVNEIVFYNIRFYDPEEDSILYLRKRYSDIRAFDERLTERFTLYDLPPLPRKELVMLTDHTDPYFMEERRALIEHYLQHVVTIPALKDSNLTAEFMGTNILREYDLIEERFQKAADEVLNQTREEVCDIWIPSTKRQKDHVLYQIHWTSPESGQEDDNNRWVALKRFKHIYQMDKKLRQEMHPAVVKLLPMLPEKQSKVVHDHLDPDFVQTRRVLLNNYFKNLLKISDVQHSSVLLEFLHIGS